MFSWGHLVDDGMRWLTDTCYNVFALSWIVCQPHGNSHMTHLLGRACNESFWITSSHCAGGNMSPNNCHSVL